LIFLSDGGFCGFDTNDEGDSGFDTNDKGLGLLPAAFYHG